MLEKRKLRLGLLGIMHGLYDEKQPEISQKQERFARDIAARLKDEVDIDFPGAAKTKTVIDKDVEEVLDTEVLEDVPMSYFHFRPATGVRQCMDGWLQNGGAHHQILFLGNHVRKCTMFNQLLGIDHVVV